MKLSALFYACTHVSYSRVGDSVDYALRKNGDALYIFFEDSDGSTDWKNNLDFPAKAYKRMERTVWFAHRGFLNAWKQVEPIVAKALQNESCEKVVIAGYSHGAALAFLCHEYVWFHYPDLRERIEGYGFGCPRVFWGCPTRALRRRWERFTVIRNENDVVTHLPPAFLGFRHMGTLLKIGKRGKYSPVDAHRADAVMRELKLYESEVTN